MTILYRFAIIYRTKIHSIVMQMRLFLMGPSYNEIHFRKGPFTKPVIHTTTV